MTDAGLRGWLGGTFDPIHEGHLDVARAARAALRLPRVTLVPARVPPHRAQPTASPEHRLAMTRLAADGTPWLDVSTFELDAEGPSYTATTLDRLEAEGVDLAGLVVITGADAFAGIQSWHRSGEVLTRVAFAVVSRPGHPVADVPGQLPSLAGAMHMVGPDGLPSGWSSSRPAIALIDAPTAPVSSTRIRAALAAGQSLQGLVPPPVAEYISRHGLYKPFHHGGHEGP